jgi:hypothetical protein
MKKKMALVDVVTGEVINVIVVDADNNTYACPSGCSLVEHDGSGMPPSIGRKLIKGTKGFDMSDKEKELDEKAKAKEQEQ